jgi:hypothetical protein
LADFESYEATADAARAKELAATSSPFKIKIRFLGGLNARQRSAFKKAADRWTRVIVGDLPRARVDGELIDDILILAKVLPSTARRGFSVRRAPPMSGPARQVPPRSSP